MITYTPQRGSQPRPGASDVEARLLPETADKPRIVFGAMNDLRPKTGDDE